MKKVFTSLFACIRFLTSFLLILVLLSAYGVRAQEQGQNINFKILAQPVGMALLDFSEQAGVQLIMAANDGQGIESKGVKGSMDAKSALDNLLDSTGLSYEFSDSNTVTVYPKTAQATQETGVSSQTNSTDNKNNNESNDPAPIQKKVRRNDSSTQNRGQTSGIIEEIVVSAEKRDESVQRIPISITAFTGEHLQRAVIEDIYDIGLMTPGVIVNKEIVGKIYIRGIGAENLTVGGDPGVALHLDGSYIARNSAAILDLYDVERVEVLRGPQGTLYGRNATGGSINIISKAPSEEFYTRADFQYGEEDRVRVAGTINGALSDNLYARASIMKSDRDGFTPNLFNGERLDDEDLLAGRVRLRFLPSSDLTIDLGVDFSFDDSKPAPFKQLEFSPLFEGLFGAFDPPGLRPVSQNSPVEEEQDQFGVTATVTWDLENTTLTSITAYRDNEFRAAFDGDATDVLIQDFINTDDSDQISQELRLSSRGWDNLEWIVGFYYFHDDAKTTISIPILAFGFDILHIADMKTDAFAVFGQATYSFSDALSFTVGLRYSDEDKSADQFSDFSFGLPTSFPLQQDLNEDSSALTPRFAVEYLLSDDTLAYASVTRGFKSGGFTFNNFQGTFDPEFVWAYEGGIKTTLLDNRVQTNLSLFYYDYSDLQVSKLVNNAGTITNAANATIWGGELEIVAKPTDFIDFNAGLAYLNAEFDKFITEDPSNPQLGTIDLAGNTLTRSPEFSANLGVQFHRPIGDMGEVRLRADYQYQSKSFFTAFNRNLSAQDNFSLVNARLSFASVDDKWEVAVFVKNAFDETYFLNILESGVETGKPEGFLAAPRTWGIQIVREFF
jgi:iron complex outermembrane recepter protein